MWRDGEGGAAGDARSGHYSDFRLGSRSLKRVRRRNREGRRASLTRNMPPDQVRGHAFAKNADPSDQDCCGTIEVRSNAGTIPSGNEDCWSPPRSNSIRRSNAVERIIG